MRGIHFFGKKSQSYEKLGKLFITTKSIAFFNLWQTFFIKIYENTNTWWGLMILEKQLFYGLKKMIGQQIQIL